jgi:uncharacterized protein YuzE
MKPQPRSVEGNDEQHYLTKRPLKGTGIESEVGTKMKQEGTLKYYPKDEVLYVMLQAGEEATSVEIEPGVTAELNTGGEVIGIEILDASV